MEVRKYTDQDLTEIIRIWNEVVEEGIAFPQEDILNIESGTEFFASQRKKTAEFMACTYCIPTMSEGVDISAMPAMLYPRM